MKIKLTSFLVLSLLFLSVQSHAIETNLNNKKNIYLQMRKNKQYPKKRSSKMIEGGSSGTRGGGSGVLTFNSKNMIQEVKLLDIFKMENRFIGFTEYELDKELQLFPKDVESSADLIYLMVLKRISDVLPQLAIKIQDAREEIGVWYDTNMIISTHHDFGKDLTLSDYELHVQIALRVANRLTYDKFLYDHMMPLHQAALKFHEYAYTISNHKNSELIQQFVALIFSSQFKTMTQDEAYTVIAKQLELEYQANPVDIDSIELPEGVSISEDIPINDNECGLMSHQNYEQRSIRVKKDILSSSKEYTLSEENWDKYHTSLKRIRKYLKAKYPDFLYPESYWSLPRVCINSYIFSTEIKRVEVNLAYKSQDNSLALDRAKLQVESYAHSHKVSILEREIERFKFSTDLSAKIYLMELVNKLAFLHRNRLANVATTTIITGPYQNKLLETIIINID